MICIWTIYEKGPLLDGPKKNPKQDRQKGIEI